MSSISVHVASETKSVMLMHGVCRSHARRKTATLRFCKHAIRTQSRGNKVREHAAAMHSFLDLYTCFGAVQVDLLTTKSESSSFITSPSPIVAEPSIQAIKIRASQ